MSIEEVFGMVAVGFTCGIVGLFIGFMMGKIDNGKNK